MKKLIILVGLAALSVGLLACNKKSELDANQVASSLQRVADWQIEHFRDNFSGRKEPHHIRDWTNGALYVGMHKWAKLSKDQRYLDWLKYISDKSDWELHWRPYMADDHVVGQLYLDLYKHYQDPKMIERTKKSIDFIRANPSTQPIELDNYANMERWTWCDALFMGPPVWAKLAKITGDKSYVDWMMKEFEATTQHLFDAEEALYYRDNSYIGKLVHGEKIFWSRGNGWVFGGLTLIMDELEVDSPEYNYFKAIYLKMAPALKAIQTNEGHWAMSLLDGKSYPTPETSGTSFFTFGMAWGINNGLLDKSDYLPVIEKAWKSLSSHITPEGMLGFVQPIGAAPGHAWADKSEVYGSGAFLAAGAEIYKMLEGNTQPSIEHSPTLDTAIKHSTKLLEQEYSKKNERHSEVLSARFVPERKDDFAWENDLVAFRAYGPALTNSNENSGTDCWLKRVDTPIIDRWYTLALKEDKSYHEDRGEGYDPYHVGSSAGCGGTSLWIDNQRKPLNTFVSYENVNVGNDHLTFTLNYEQTTEGDIYKEQKNIRLKPGQRLFNVESTFWKNGTLAKNLPITVGVTTHEDKAKLTFDEKQKLLFTWESIDEQGLGTAILLETSQPVETKHISSSKKDESHGLLVTKTDSNGKIVYYAGYGWEKGKGITSVSAWQQYLNTFIEQKPYH
jgi:rhamnogalacturonyl hydrolase YesR